MNQVRLARRREFVVLNEIGTNFSPQGPAIHYQLEAYLEGGLNDLGVILNIRDFDGLLARLLAEYEGRAINKSSLELAKELFVQLRSLLADQPFRLVQLRLFESPDFWVDVCE